MNSNSKNKQGERNNARTLGAFWKGVFRKWKQGEQIVVETHEEAKRRRGRKKEGNRQLRKRI
jgi:hypothetical protein